MLQGLYFRKYEQNCPVGSFTRRQFLRLCDCTASLRVAQTEQHHVHFHFRGGRRDELLRKCTCEKLLEGAEKCSDISGTKVTEHL